MDDRISKALDLLAKLKKHLTKQEYKTFAGQIKAGDIKGAAKGLERVLEINGEGSNNMCCPVDDAYEAYSRLQHCKWLWN